jgi:putative nucleotidyltransferase-like protein
MMTAEDADTLGDVFEIVQRMRLRHQLEQLEAGGTPSDMIGQRDMSTIDASVLDDAIREILAVQRRMANTPRRPSERERARPGSRRCVLDAASRRAPRGSCGGPDAPAPAWPQTAPSSDTAAPNAPAAADQYGAPQYRGNF